MVPAYHDALTAMIFAIVGMTILGWACGRHHDAVDMPAAGWLGMTHIGFAIAYLVVWLADK